MWVVGFADGEGCFSVSFHSNERFAKRSFGWQVNPSFHLYQHVKHCDVLQAVRTHFGVGRISSKGPGSEVLTYTVQRRSELMEIIIPFFEKYPLKVKASDFRVFCEIVRLIDAGKHFTRDGFETIARLAYSMNEQGKQRARSLEQILKGSSETVRQARIARS
jgi:hypothetical protein